MRNLCFRYRFQIHGISMETEMKKKKTLEYFLFSEAIAKEQKNITNHQFEDEIYLHWIKEELYARGNIKTKLTESGIRDDERRG